MRPRCRSCHTKKNTQYARTYNKRKRENLEQFDSEESIHEAPPATRLELEVKAGAACRGFPGWLNKAPAGGFGHAERVHWKPRRDVCAACPVLEKCREWNEWWEHAWHRPTDLNHPDRLSGMVAGETPAERIERRKAEQLGAA